MYQFSITSLLGPLSRSAVKDHHKGNLFFFHTKSLPFFCLFSSPRRMDSCHGGAVHVLIGIASVGVSLHSILYMAMRGVYIAISGHVVSIPRVVLWDSVCVLGGDSICLPSSLGILHSCAPSGILFHDLGCLRCPSGAPRCWPWETCIREPYRGHT